MFFVSNFVDMCDFIERMLTVCAGRLLPVGCYRPAHHAKTTRCTQCPFREMGFVKWVSQCCPKMAATHAPDVRGRGGADALNREVPSSIKCNSRDHPQPHGIYISAPRFDKCSRLTKSNLIDLSALFLGGNMYLPSKLQQRCDRPLWL